MFTDLLCFGCEFRSKDDLKEKIEAPESIILLADVIGCGLQERGERVQLINCVSFGSPVIPHGVHLSEDFSAKVADGGRRQIVIRPSSSRRRHRRRRLVGPLVNEQIVLLVEGPLAVSTLERVQGRLGHLARSANTLITPLRPSPPPLHSPPRQGSGLLHVQRVQGEHLQASRIKTLPLLAASLCVLSSGYGRRGGWETGGRRRVAATKKATSLLGEPAHVRYCTGGREEGGREALYSALLNRRLSLSLWLLRGSAE